MTEAVLRVPVRERILRTAARLFYRHGVRAVGIDTIIARSGVAKMSLYRSFASKDELVAAWLAERNVAFWRRWDAAVAAAGEDPRAGLEAILDMVAARVAAPAWQGCPFLKTWAEFPEGVHPARQVIEANRVGVHVRLAALAQATGARDPALLADQLQVLIDGAYINGQTHGPGGPACCVAGAGRVLIAAQIGRPDGVGAPI
ncbi:MAG TPA: TetR/AcrR family transcriptional regulator [Acetobacteraceae bacterium]|nr:TetR/AcrR family transcriptional regulator [Acetobacteraceae bacterium]